MNMQRIEIYDRDKTGVLAPDFATMLGLIESYRDDLRWFLLEIEATGQLEGEETMLELENRIRRSPHGVELDWQEANAIAKQISQAINLTLVGCRRDEPPPSMPFEIGDVELVIEIVDSTFCAVSTRSPDLMFLVRSQFLNTKLVSI